ncbi:MAG: phosphoglucosamine mutase, partial [Betaproteobacteria bacterium]|nr:phosphoglucosamine mutase [Betaproteobacteria bacterium]
MTRNHFGTDGIRGTVGEAPMTADFVLRLGYAAGKVLAAREKGAADRPGVLIGKDTRISGYMIEAALEAGFSAAGVDVLLCGPLPTPGVAYLTRALRLAAGVVISASHNPYGDNGIKFFSGNGFKLADAVEAEIERALEQPIGCNASAQLGRAQRIDDAGGRYVEFCKSTFPAHLDLRGLRVVVDCAHGAAYSVAPNVFHELGADVVPVGVSPDGFNINDLFGATSPAQLQAAVLRHQADLGIALDGDGDRLIMVDAQGALYDGDQLLYAIARHRAGNGKVAGVAGTLMTNLALEQAFARMGVAFARARVGDRYVLEMMREKGWQLGGENSGHIICLDRHTTGDGIVSALQVLAAMRESQKTLGELTADLVMFPQVLV